MPEEKRIGEVIEACSTDFTAQTYELYETPALGSLVKVHGDTDLWVYGIVYNTLTSGVEPGRRPIARGKDETDEAGIYRSSPQLTKLLKSEFNVLAVGYRQGEKTYQYLSPVPARIHGFVYLCPSNEVKQYSCSFDFLNILLKAKLETPVEQLVSASLREISAVYGAERHAFLVSAGKELAALLSRDYAQLKAILKGLKYDAT